FVRVWVEIDVEAPELDRRARRLDVGDTRPSFGGRAGEQCAGRDPRHARTRRLFGLGRNPRRRSVVVDVGLRRLLAADERARDRYACRQREGAGAEVAAPPSGGTRGAKSLLSL